MCFFNKQSGPSDEPLCLLKKYLARLARKVQLLGNGISARLRLPLVARHRGLSVSPFGASRHLPHRGRRGLLGQPHKHRVCACRICSVFRDANNALTTQQDAAKRKPKARHGRRATKLTRADAPLSTVKRSCFGSPFWCVMLFSSYSRPRPSPYHQCE